VSKIPDLLDSNGAADALGVSLRRVQQLILSGRLPATKMGGSYVVKRGDLAAVKDRKPGRPASKSIAKEKTTKRK
jgi:excisionase family DNA binding protein